MTIENVAEAIIALKRADWSIGDAAFAVAPGDRVWVVSGRNGENLVHAEESAPAEAWERALGQARSVGKLGRVPSRAVTRME